MSLRLLMSADAVGGVWVYALDLAAALAAFGVTVELAVLGPAPSAAQKQAAAQAGLRVHETGLALDWMGGPEELAEAAAALAGLAARMRADVVQVHTPALVGAVRWPAPVLAVLHSCVGTWWRAVRGHTPCPADFVWRMAAVRAGLRNAETVIAPSRALAVQAAQVYGHQNIRVVHNGRMPPAPHADGARYGVLAAGRLWDEAKNILVLDQAAALMPDVPVAAAGSVNGPHGAVVELHHARALGTLTGDGMADAMAGARIFASPAVYEPFGLAVLEAAQNGLPLVLADIPSFRELWDGAAIFLPPHDAALWTETLGSLHGRPEQCQRLGAQARQRAERYSLTRCAAAMMALYQPALALSL
jgi:glycosyltransferase involved in cell wall biosynthesis